MEILKDNFTSELVRATVVSSSSVAGLSTVSCVAAISTLVCYKMYRHFTYRLVLYTLLTLAVFSLSDMLYLIIMYVDEGKHLLDQMELFFGFVYTSTFCCSLVLMICYTFYFYTLAVRYQKYNKWIYDFNCLLMSITLSLLYTGISFSLCHGRLETLLQYNNLSPAMGCTIDATSTVTVILAMFIVGLMLIVTNAFMFAALITLCSKAHKQEDSFSKNSYKQALKEITPLVIVPLLCSVYTAVFCVFDQVVPMVYNVQKDKRFTHVQLFTGILGATLGTAASVAFGIHLWVLGKDNRNRLINPRKRRPKKSTYGATGFDVQAQFVTPGLSDSCPTEYLYPET